MTRHPRLLAAAIVAALALLALSLYMRSWGGLALLALGAAAVAWYRVQVARSEAAQDFFGDMGEETRLTNFQPGGASELPGERSLGERPQGSPPEGR